MNLSNQSEQESAELTEPHPDNTPDTPKQKWYSLFIPSQGYIVTPILLYINVILFANMLLRGTNLLTPNVEMLIEMGANIRVLTLDNEPWRLFTSMFIHAGIIHLLFNMYALISIGRQLEPIVGPMRFAAFYVFTGIIASLASMMWHINTASVGASGAIFGMFGLFIGLLVSKTIYLDNKREILTSMLVFIGYNLMIGMKEGIDNAAHIGGLISGFIFGLSGGYFMVVEQNRSKYNTVIVGAAATIVFCLLGMGMTNNNIKRYEEQMQLFKTRENEALAILRMNPDMPAEEIEYQLIDRGVYYWEENIELIKEMKALKLPDNINEYNSILIKYCELRIESYRLLSKIYTESTDKYDDEFKKCNEQIEQLLASSGQ